MYTRVKIIDDKDAVFKCNKCDQVVRIDAPDSVRQPNHKLDLSCRCGHLNRSVVEYRASIRKNINIPGIYKTVDPEGKVKTGSMTVKNISWQGFKLIISGEKYGIKEHDIHCHRYKQDGHNDQSLFVKNYLQTDDRIIIEFFLDDPKMSFISRPVRVKWLKRDSIGVELCNPEAFEPSIRYYLLGL